MSLGVGGAGVEQTARQMAADGLLAMSKFHMLHRAEKQAAAANEALDRLDRVSPPLHEAVTLARAITAEQDAPTRAAALRAALQEVQANTIAVTSGTTSALACLAVHMIDAAPEHAYAMTEAALGELQRQPRDDWARFVKTLPPACGNHDRLQLLTQLWEEQPQERAHQAGLLLREDANPEVQTLLARRLADDLSQAARAAKDPCQNAAALLQKIANLPLSSSRSTTSAVTAGLDALADAHTSPFDVAAAAVGSARRDEDAVTLGTLALEYATPEWKRWGQQLSGAMGTPKAQAQALRVTVEAAAQNKKCDTTQRRATCHALLSEVDDHQAALQVLLTNSPQGCEDVKAFLEMSPQVHLSDEETKRGALFLLNPQETHQGALSLSAACQLTSEVLEEREDSSVPPAAVGWLRKFATDDTQQEQLRILEEVCAHVDFHGEGSSRVIRKGLEYLSGEREEPIVGEPLADFTRELMMENEQYTSDSAIAQVGLQSLSRRATAQGNQTLADLVGFLQAVDNDPDMSESERFGTYQHGLGWLADNSPSSLQGALGPMVESLREASEGGSHDVRLVRLAAESLHGAAARTHNDALQARADLVASISSLRTEDMDNRRSAAVGALDVCSSAETAAGLQGLAQIATASREHYGNWYERRNLTNLFLDTSKTAATHPSEACMLGVMKSLGEVRATDGDYQDNWSAALLETLSANSETAPGTLARVGVSLLDQADTDSLREVARPLLDGIAALSRKMGDNDFVPQQVEDARHRLEQCKDDDEWREQMAREMEGLSHYSADAFANIVTAAEKTRTDAPTISQHNDELIIGGVKVPVHE